MFLYIKILMFLYIKGVEINSRPAEKRSNLGNAEERYLDTEAVSA
jgi:hypothetical protein